MLREAWNGDHIVPQRNSKRILRRQLSGLAAGKMPTMTLDDCAILTVFLVTVPLYGGGDSKSVAVREE